MAPKRNLCQSSFTKGLFIVYLSNHLRQSEIKPTNNKEVPPVSNDAAKQNQPDNYQRIKNVSDLCKIVFQTTRNEQSRFTFFTWKECCIGWKQHEETYFYCAVCCGEHTLQITGFAVYWGVKKVFFLSEKWSNFPNHAITTLSFLQNAYRRSIWSNKPDDWSCCESSSDWHTAIELLKKSSCYTGFAKAFV